MKLRELFVDPKSTVGSCAFSFACGAGACFSDSGGAVVCAAAGLYSILCWWIGEWRGESMWPSRK